MKLLIYRLQLYLQAIIYCSLTLIVACGQKTEIGENTFPKHFKIEMPYIPTLKGLITIDAYFGNNKILHKLLLDNNSPTWANEKVVNGNSSISKSKNFLYKTTSADGKQIKGEVYVCSSIEIATLRITDVLLYKISGAMGNIDGALGENVMSKGVWEINFKQNKIIFASSIDSISDVPLARSIPANFSNNNTILISGKFGNNILQDVQVDLGFNGAILLPMKSFYAISQGNKKIATKPYQFSTPSGSRQVKNTIAFDSVKLGNINFHTILMTNEDASESLIGIGFFQQFDYIIIDYKNKKLFLSPN